jgi:hypothetical protein
VRGGGAILSDPYFCPYTDSFYLDTRVPGGGFDGVFGCRERDIHRAEAEVEVRLEGRTYRVRGSHFREEFTLAGGRALAAYAGDAGPAAVSNGWGSGTATILGLDLGLAYSPRLGVGDDFAREGDADASGDARSLAMALMRPLGLRGAFSCDCADIHGGFLRGPGAEDLLIVTSGADERRSARLGIGTQFASCNELTGGAPVAVERGVVSLVFGPLQTLVLKLRKRA